MNALDPHCRCWLQALCLSAGLLGCGPQPAPHQTAADARAPDDAAESRNPIQTVKGHLAEDGTPYAMWVEHQVDAAGGIVVFSDWSEGPGTVRFTFVTRGADYDLTTSAFEWRIGESGMTVSSPRRVAVPDRKAVP